MAPRGHDWFGNAQLLPGEHLLRSGPARLRTASAPYWWEGDLILTTLRLLFLAHAENPLLPDAGFWVAEISSAAPGGRDRILVRAGQRAATFEVLGNVLQPAGILGGRARPWIDQIQALQRSAPARPEASEEPPRRAAG